MRRKTTRPTTGEGSSRRKSREVVLPRECKLCIDSVTIDYKQPDLLKKFMTERGKILPRRISGNCARHQRAITCAIKRARVMLLGPVTTPRRPCGADGNNQQVMES